MLKVTKVRKTHMMQHVGFTSTTTNYLLHVLEIFQETIGDLKLPMNGIYKNTWRKDGRRLL